MSLTIRQGFLPTRRSISYKSVKATNEYNKLQGLAKNISLISEVNKK